MHLRLNRTGAIALALLLGISPLGVLGSAAFSQTLRTDGISQLNQVVQMKDNAANDAALEGAARQRELLEQQQRLRQAEEARTRLRQAPNEVTDPVTACPQCVLTAPMASADGDDKD